MERCSSHFFRAVGGSRCLLPDRHETAHVYLGRTNDDDAVLLTMELLEIELRTEPQDDRAS